MKIKSLFIAMMLVSAGSSAILQPAIPIKEDSSFRITGGFYMNSAVKSVRYSPGSVQADLGTKDISGALSFTHFVRPDLFYGLGISLGVSSVRGFPFSEDGQAYKGMRMDTEFTLGFLPELAQRFHLGVVGKLGYGRQFGEEAKQAFTNEQIKFGDLNFKAGLAMSIGFNDWVGLYITPSYTLTSIRFFEGAATEVVRAKANLSGMELPLGVYFSFGSVGMFLETKARFLQFKELGLGHNWRQQLSLGVSYTF